jgi:hypothetical protein
MRTTWKSKDLAEKHHPIGRGAAASAAKQIRRGPAVIAGTQPERLGHKTDFAAKHPMGYGVIAAAAVAVRRKP